MDSPNALSYLIVYCQCLASVKDGTHDDIVTALYIIIHIYIYTRWPCFAVVLGVVVTVVTSVIGCTHRFVCFEYIKKALNF